MLLDAPAGCSKNLVMQRLSRNLCWAAANLLIAAGIILLLTNPDRPLALILVILGAAVFLAVLPLAFKKEAAKPRARSVGQ
jgi:hypothetical protein